jgi:DNA polymerase IV
VTALPDRVTAGALTTGRTILHVDMDAFFVSVELLDRPDLVGQPVVVGGPGRRGVIAAANYEARRHGVHSAMSSVRAQALCPDLVFLPGRFHLYSAASLRIMETFAQFTPLVEPISLDEAFLDVTGAQRLFGSPADIARQVRAAVFATEGLWCSVGVASTKFVAKLASRAAKPRPGGPAPTVDDDDGVLVVGDGEVLSFLHPLAVSELWGVGPVTLGRLNRHGVETVGDLARLPVGAVVSSLGSSAGQHLHALAHGIDPRPVVPGRREKSVGHEQTYAEDLVDRAGMDRELLRLCDAVASRLATKGLAGATVTVKVRFSDFRTITRSHSPGEPMTTTTTLVDHARRLVADIEPAPGVRLLGVSVSGLGPADTGHQLSFDEFEQPTNRREVQQTVDAIRHRWGQAAIGPAALLDDSGLRLRRTGDAQWGPALPPSPDPVDPMATPGAGPGAGGG